jgi:hypothetical protein
MLNFVGFILAWPLDESIFEKGLFDGKKFGIENGSFY